MKTWIQISILFIGLFLIFSFQGKAATKTVQSITVTQPDTFAMKGMPDQPVLLVNINVAGTDGALILQKLIIKTSNQDNTDVDSTAVYITPYSRFSLADYPGEASLLVKKNKIVNDSIVLKDLTYSLQTGNNYFWVVMDLDKYSKASHSLDAFVPANGIVISGTSFPEADVSPSNSIIIHSIYYTDNFEYKNQSGEPIGWEQVKSPTTLKKWINNYGGHSISTSAHPIAPISGALNVMLQKTSYTSDTVILMSKPLDLSLSDRPILTFYHSQVAWCKDAYCTISDNDELIVMYKIGTDGTWHNLNEYKLATPNTWLKRVIILPDEASAGNVFLGFKGVTKYGWGVCLDSLVIYEANIVNREVNSIIGSQPVSDIIPQGSDKNPVLRLNIRIKGNTGNITLNSIKVNSANTSDNDIKPAGVRIWSTNDSLFLSPVLIGSGQTFSGGTVTFSGLNKALETGENYFWITYDVSPGADPGNTLDARIDAGDINISGSVATPGPFPSSTISPAGNRLIKQTLFSDDFEGTSAWSLTGLFQTGEPLGLGGLQIGMPDPTSAYSGTKVLGTALSPSGDYEKNISYANAYKATTSLIDAKYFKNIRLDYERWLNIDNTDSACIEYRSENETSWRKLWESGKKYVETKWQKETFNNLKQLQRKKFSLRFRLGPTDAIDEYSGWNIDYLFITADSIPMDASVTKIVYPLTSCDLSASEHVKVYVKNTGPKPLLNTPVKLSINGGKTFVNETIPGPVAPDDSILFTFSAVSDFSKKTAYQIIVKSAHPLDNFNENDSISKEISSLPTFSLPYRNNFEKDTTFWTGKGLNSSWYHGWPGGSYIGNPAEGDKCWKTDFSGYHNFYEYSYLESPCFSFAGKEMPLAEFRYSVDASNQMDGAILQYSTDNGQTWNYVPGDNYNYPWNWYNDTVITLQRKGWTGRTLIGEFQEWRTARQVLPSSLANQSKVRLRVVFKSDSSTTSRREGFAFDDIKLYDAPFDIGVSAINGINNPSCQNENSPYLNLTIKNFGYQRMKTGDTIVVGVKINGLIQVVDTLRLNSSLDKDATLSYTMKKRVNFDAAGDYTLKAFTMVEKDAGFYGTDNDTATVVMTVRPNPVTGLRKTYATARLDTMQLKPVFDSKYSYKWTYKGVDSLIRVKTAKDTGKYILGVTNTTTLCQTTDTISVLPLKLDIGVNQIISPVTGCGYSTSYKPVVKITNYGTDTLAKNKTIPLKIRFDSNPVVSDAIVLSKALAPDSSYVTEINWSADFLTAGSHQLMAATDMSPYDTNAANDSSKNTFDIYSYPIVDLGPDVYVRALSHTLKLFPGYSQYLWSDGSDKDSLKITSSGKYKVSVTNSNGCVAKDSVVVTLGIHDLKIKRLISPQTLCAASGLYQVSCWLMNNGTDTIKTGETISLKCSVNGGNVYSQPLNLSNPMFPGDSVTFSFTQQLDLSQPNTYRFKLSSSVNNDIVRENDTIQPVIRVFANPKIDLGKDDDKLLYQYKLLPGSGYQKYLWQDGSQDTAYLITQTHFDPLGTYSVTVTDENGCTDSDTVVIHLLVDDIRLKEIKFPETSCQKYGKDTIFVKVVNSGNRPVFNKDIDISYQVNDSTRIGEMFKFTGNPNDSAVYRLSVPVKLWKVGLNKISATISMSGDVRRNNDTLTHFTDVKYGAIIDFGAVRDTLIVDLPHMLDAGSGSEFKYLWNTGDTTRTLLVSSDNEYRVTVTSNECVNTKRVVVINRYFDLGVLEVGTSGTKCLTDGKKKKVSMEITNSGKMTLKDQPIVIKYKVNGNTEKMQNVLFTGKPGSKAVYDFNDSVQLSAAGEYLFTASLQYSEDESSENNQKTISVKMTSPPVINFEALNDTVKVASLPYTLDAGSGENYTYKWQDNSNLQTLQVTNSGTYTVTVTNGACTSSRSVVVWQATPVRVISDKAKILLYPNPAHEQLKIDLSVQNENDVMLEFVSQNGRVISLHQFAGSRQYSDIIEVGSLPRGLYYVRIYQRGWLVIEKVMLQ